MAYWLLRTRRSATKMADSSKSKILNLFLMLMLMGPPFVNGVDVDYAQPSRPKLLLIIIDGLSNDYLNNANLSGFESFLSNGSRTEYLTPVFPSMTFPNIFSMLTGVNPAHHGFVSDVVYDPAYMTNFTGDESNFEQQPYWWNQSDPVWATAQEQGIRTGIYSLFGCQVPVRKISPFSCQRYAKLFHQDTVTFETSVSEALRALAGNYVNFAIVYTEYLDINGHTYGPKSPEMRKAVKMMDDSIKHVLKEIEDVQLTDKLNVIMASDHGMADVSDRNKRMTLESIIQEDDIEFITGSGTFVGIYPKADKVTKVYDDLKHANWFTTWKKKDIPNKYHIKWSNRTAPIVIAAKPGYLIVPLFSEKQIPMPLTKTPITQLGAHGYDPSEVKEMNGILYARGPDIKKNLTVPAMQMVDVYNFMTCLLNITGHQNNGTWTNVCDLMTTKCNGCSIDVSKSSFSSQLLANWILVLGSVLVIIKVNSRR